MGKTCNSTLDDMRIGDSEAILVGSITFHTLGIILCAIFGLIGIVVSWYHICMHAWHYTKPQEQKQIMRILFMVPVFCVGCFLQFVFYWHAIYFEVIAEAYEAIALASFFSLVCSYIAPNVHDQKEYFRHMTDIQPWIWPMKSWKRCTGGEKGPFRTPSNGLTWFNIVFAAVYQYCFIMLFLCIVSILTEARDKYCASSDSPAFFHIWDTIIKTVSVIAAMVCIIQTYKQLKAVLKPYGIITKIVAIKLVIFLSFWQNFLLNILTTPTVGAIVPTDTLAYPDIRVGIPNLLLIIEMACFSVFHLYAFSYKPYVPGHEHNRPRYPIPDGVTFTSPEYNNIADKNLGGFLGISAFIDALNIWDLVSAVARSFRWVFAGRKKRHLDKSYQKSTVDTDAGYPSHSIRSPQQQALEPDTDGEQLIANAAPESGYVNEPYSNTYGSNTYGQHQYHESSQGQWVTQADLDQHQQQPPRPPQYGRY